MKSETMSMSVRQARNEVIDIGGFFDTETLTYVDNLIEAVRAEHRNEMTAEIASLKAERDRLTDELASAKEQWEADCGAAKALRDTLTFERDQLRKERDEAQYQMKHWHEEGDSDKNWKQDSFEAGYKLGVAYNEEIHKKAGERDRLAEKNKDLHDRLATQKLRANELEAKVAELERDYKTNGVCAIAADNPNAASYCNEWESRAIKAESKCAELESSMRLATREIGKYAGQCGRLEVDLEMEKAKVAELQKAVDKKLRTKDGVLLQGGMNLWVNMDGTEKSGPCRVQLEDGEFGAFIGGSLYYAEWCYSTREAAAIASQSAKAT